MKTGKYLFVLILITLATTSTDAQLFDRLKKRTMDKLEQKAEDKLVEELSEEIARRAFRPIDKAMDDMLRSSYEEQQGGEVDWEKAGQSYADFLAGMNKKANVPPTYAFDMVLDIEVKDGEKEKHKMQYFFSKKDAYMGIKQEREANSMIIMDAENDVVIIYTEEDGKKKAQAIPSVMKMAGMFASANEDTPAWDIEKTGKTKKIAGYKCEEWKMKSEDEEVEAYIAPDFPVNFKDTFGKMWDNFMSENYKTAAESLNGMVLKSEYKSKENKKYNSKWEVKKIKEESITIDNAEYGLAQNQSSSE